MPGAAAVCHTRTVKSFVFSLLAHVVPRALSRPRVLLGAASLLLVPLTAALAQPEGGSAGPPVLDGQETDVLPPGEPAARARFLESTIRLHGVVWDEEGQPLEGAVVEVGAAQVQTRFDGTFSFEALPRANVLLRVRHAGRRLEQRPVHLFRGLDTAEVQLEPILLSLSDPQTTRFAFGGDTAFGRRFLDPSDQTPTDMLPADPPGALIRTSDPEPGTRDALRFVKPLLEEPDYTILNLESPVTNDPSTPHPTKDFSFFTLPGSLPALQWAGVDYVSLGNNHVYDYLEAGLADTLDALATVGLPFSGAGLDPETAFAPFEVDLGGQPYSFLSMNSISGRQHEITYVAETVGGVTKGGAADLTNADATRLSIVAARTRGRHPIAQLHQGSEYVLQPSDFLLRRMDDVAGAGAAIIIAHHSHTAQGFGWHQGILAAHCLGNFAFDQARLETMLGLMVRTDLRGSQLRRAQAVPVYLEDFRPRPIGGRLADHLMRRVASVSDDRAATVLSRNGTGAVLLPGQEAATVRRTVRRRVHVDERGWGVLDLRTVLRSGESVRSVRAAPAVTRLRAGRDLLLFGDVEDYDVDDLELEAARWDVSAGSGFACMDQARGAAALCSTRDSSNRSTSKVALRNRVRVEGDPTDEPIKDVTLLASIRGDNAGAMQLRTEYRASAGPLAFGEEIALSLPGGTYGWAAHAADLTIPPDDPDLPGETDNARAIRLFIEHDPPARGGLGLLQVDDVAFASWKEQNNSDRLDLTTPNTVDFLRAEGPTGTHVVDLDLVRSAQRLDCVPDVLTLCIRDRYRVQIGFSDFSGTTGRGRAVELSDDTGAFWFFDDANLEVIVKVLDATGVNGHDWVFFASLSDTSFELSVSDLWTGDVRRYVNPLGSLASRGDTTAFEGTVVSGPLAEPRPESHRPRRSETLRLGEGRFELTVRWRDFSGGAGQGQARALTSDTGAFWFFDEDNLEVVAKVLDGRAINGHFWLFYGSLSNVEFTLELTDRVTGQTQQYFNPQGEFGSQSDIRAIRATVP